MRDRLTREESSKDYDLARRSVRNKGASSVSVIVRPARPGDEPACQKIMNDVKNLVWLGGFTLQAELIDRVKAQESNGMPTLVVVEKGGEVVATSEISPNQAYVKMGLVAVDPRYRDFEPTSPGEKRSGFGSAMYALHTLRAAFEGKTFLLDQTLFFYILFDLFFGNVCL